MKSKSQNHEELGSVGGQKSLQVRPNGGTKETSWVFLVFGTLGAIGVGLGAFGAHALKNTLSVNDLEIWKTAVFYMMIHTLAGIFLESRHPKKGIAVLMLMGIVIFSGSLFALVLTQFRFLGAITPIGGLSFIAGWLLSVRCELRCEVHNWGNSATQMPQTEERTE